MELPLQHPDITTPRSMVTKTGEPFVLESDYLTRLKLTFPDVDLEQQFMEMELWLEANPSRRKTPGGMKRFITLWVSKADKEQKRQSKRNANSTRSRSLEDDLTDTSWAY
jgi:hypothetical protein